MMKNTYCAEKHIQDVFYMFFIKSTRYKKGVLIPSIFYCYIWKKHELQRTPLHLF